MERIGYKNITRRMLNQENITMFHHSLPCIIPQPEKTEPAEKILGDIT